MSSGIFNPQNRFWRTLDHFADLLILSLLWLFFSLPLVTAGAAATALYDAVAHCVRGTEPLPWKRFWQTFRKELPCAAIVTVAWGALLVLLGWALELIWAAAAAGSAAAPLVLVFCLVLMILPVGAACWMFPLLSRFTFRPVGLMMTALRLAVGCLPRSVAGVLNAAVWAVLGGGMVGPAGHLAGGGGRVFSALLGTRFPLHQHGRKRTQTQVRRVV